MPVNCIIIGIFPPNSEESSSRNQFKLDLLLDLSPLLLMEKRFLSSGKFFSGKVGSCQSHHSEKQLPLPPLSIWIISNHLFYQMMSIIHDTIHRIPKVSKLFPKVLIVSTFDFRSINKPEKILVLPISLGKDINSNLYLTARQTTVCENQINIQTVNFKSSYFHPEKVKA